MNCEIAKEGKRKKLEKQRKGRKDIKKKIYKNVNDVAC